SRRKKIDAVVAPSKISREIGDRHHLNHADSNPGQLRQLFGRGLPRSFPRKRADVHFVNDLAFHFYAAPFGVRPLELRRINNARGPVRPVRLKTRGGIGMKMLGLVYAKTVKRAGSNIRTAGKITALLSLQSMKRPLRIFLRAFFKDK